MNALFNYSLNTPAAGFAMHICLYLLTPWLPIIFSSKSPKGTTVIGPASPLINTRIHPGGLTTILRQPL